MKSNTVDCCTLLFTDFPDDEEETSLLLSRGGSMPVEMLTRPATVIVERVKLPCPANEEVVGEGTWIMLSVICFYEI